MNKINELARDFFEKKMKLDGINEAAKEAKGDKDIAEGRLVEEMVKLGMQKTSFEGMGTFSLRTSSNWNIVDQKALVAYLKENAPEMIKIHPQTIKGWANEFKGSKEDAPLMNEDDWINYFGMKPYDKIAITLRKA